MISALIVEDEQIIRKGLIYTMDWKGMRTEIIGEASNGKEGLEKIIGLKPDVVITDIKMPIMSGIEMVEQALNHHDFETIILSSYSDFEYTKKSIQLQVFDYLLKPVDEDALKEVMFSLYDRLEKRKRQSLLTNRVDVETLAAMFFPNQDSISDYTPYTRRLIESIKERYSEKISLEELAAEMGVSPSYLSRVFKKDTNGTFHHYLNQERIRKSIPLLLSNNYMIYEIAELAGFNDYKQYNSVFKKYTGFSPTEFIQKIKLEKE
ncbi:response regulator transcription factor [Bacillus sp. FJAT-27245]|uniref:response regulator transcription factor n=1 Tax=Bacillus sp. FJAT-27245 TaxID=1684144 RepID=UPI0006A7789F|nr:response regulator [Bacillus sp. FJAT-27245]